ncbi:hypothetical protein B0H14DRAFT_2906596 [Mycena olivaceomarginata]|nr:hypothetical protein B0H14DRAFT_2906596 [Mycena olivaceomarginata]
MSSGDDVHQPHSGDAPYGHILSDKSVELQRDTFFFAHMGGFPIRLVLGLNQQITPVTSATLRRWADLMVGEHHKFFLSPVTVNPKGIMSYSMTPSGPIIPPDSDEPLPPGKLWLVSKFQSGPVRIPRAHGGEYGHEESELRAQRNIHGRQQLLALYTFPPDLGRRVLARDAQRCRVTGDTVNIMLTWIVPPPWGWTVANLWDPPEIAPRLSDDGLHPLGMDSTPFLVAANAITLRKDLKLHFYNHNFTVDADDNYRIVILRDMGEAQNLLPTHLPRHPEHDPNDVTFFRLHLRYSMNFMLLGGDIREKYPPHVILHEMDQLGVPGPCDSDDPDREDGAVSRPALADRIGPGDPRGCDSCQGGDKLEFYSDEESDSDSEEDEDESAGVCALPPPHVWDWHWDCEVEEAQGVPEAYQALGDNSKAWPA